MQLNPIYNQLDCKASNRTTCSLEHCKFGKIASYCCFGIEWSGLSKKISVVVTSPLHLLFSISYLSDLIRTFFPLRAKFLSDLTVALCNQSVPWEK